ncbi:MULTISPECIES: ABC transporter ATP-binding protein [Burkholderia]|uniref:ABC transporter n=1 Tax=Burkholderia paludis TaxID=1506587 RepID=A0A6P2LCJ9_9BURK|nr:MULTISPECIES: ABC transporter ATP-binding protein [Burkholderia]CAB3753020.1 putative ABC transporter ATP-binding protein [Burkholderia paludis]VWB64883.1 ABC transporter [Burkholderia paludis]
MTRERDDGPWPTLLGLLRGHRASLVAAMALAVCAAGLDLVPCALLCESAVRLFDGERGAWLPLLGGFALALLGKYLLHSFAYYLSHRAAYRVLMDTRQRLARQLAIAPLVWLQRHESGALGKLLMQDVGRIEQFIAHHLVEVTAATVAPALVFVVLLAIDWRLAAAAVATLPLAILFQAIAMRGFGPLMADYQRAVADLNGASVEYLRGMRVMKTYRQDAHSFARMREGLGRYHDLVRRVTRRTVPGWSVFMVLLNANLVLLLPLGLWLAARGEIGIAGLLLALVLGSGMLRPLFKLMRVQHEMREILACVARMQPLLALREPVARAAVAVPGHAVAFERVRFGYGAAPVLHDLSFDAPAGCMTALVGPSGAGKSTVASLLGGLVEPEGGAIRIGGVPLSSLGDAQRAAAIAVVSQDTFLFRGSLLDNLRLGRPDASDADARRALRIAQLDALVDALPDGWHTDLGEAGARLSGGERQRLAVARALLADTPVLVLDESTAFADSRTERRFLDALRDGCPGKTLIVIAHRLYTIRDAAHIVVLDAGRVAGAGEHGMLLRDCACYRRMWDAQSHDDAWTLGTRAAPNAAPARVHATLPERAHG